MSAIEDTASSTRIFVSGLPLNFTSKQLREHFSKHFDVTDAHVFPDRRIAFVGLTDHASAQKASSYFNKSFIRMSKISVELAKPFDLRKDGKGQATPVSKRGLDSRNNQSRQATKRKREVPDDGEDLRNKADDDTQRLKSKVDDNEQDEPNPPDLAKPAKSAKGEHSVDQDVVEDAENAQSNNATDSDWLRGKTSRVLDLVDPVESQIHQGSPAVQSGEVPSLEDGSSPRSFDGDVEEEHESKEPETDPPQILNGRLFLRNLPFTATENDLANLFTPFGNIEEVHLVKDKKSSTSKGTAFVQFFDPPDAGRALSELDGKPFQGRLLHILPASDRKDTKLSEFEISKLPLKKQKALKRKAEASSASFSWNSLYMNPDAVLASVANRLGVSKSDLLDPSSADAAVKQAQAETSIIQETKEYLRAQGIDAEAFKNRTRDDRSLLLKNFPFGTTSEELSAMLSEYGKVVRIIFPPTGTMAIARFEEPHQAQAALKGLAYKNLKGSVLYLERAPNALFDVKSSNVPLTGDHASDGDGAEEKPETRTTASVFVRNLNFATTSTRLTEVFKPLSGFLSARVKTRTDTARPGQVLSMGFGFVEFRTKTQAEAAVATMNNHRLDGHEILVQPSQKSLDAADERRKEDAVKRSDQQKTKLVIKNLPFEASKKDVKTLLQGYGTLRSVRMPKKFDQSARGFAFADFVTAKEARNAMDTLSNTHLLGRRLVIDFADGDAEDPEEAIKAMEKKAGRQLHLNAVNKMMTGSSRKKFNVDARDDGE